jgi:hypothetical protein
MELFVKKPSHEVYYGIKVNGETKLEFKNDHVKQRLENLVLYTEYKIENEAFKSEVKNEVYLKEGMIVLLEEKDRGYFVPQYLDFCTMQEFDDEIDFLKKEISKCKE